MGRVRDWESKKRRRKGKRGGGQSREERTRRRGRSRREKRGGGKRWGGLSKVGAWGTRSHSLSGQCAHPLRAGARPAFRYGLPFVCCPKLACQPRRQRPNLFSSRAEKAQHPIRRHTAAYSASPRNPITGQRGYNSLPARPLKRWAASELLPSKINHVLGINFH